MEGIAGFGTPAALGAPLMVAIGFTLLSAVTLALIADSSPVTFGEGGTPIQLDLKQGLLVGGEPALAISQYLGAITPLDEWLSQVVVVAAGSGVFIGMFIPLLRVVAHRNVWTGKALFRWPQNMEICSFCWLSL